MENGLRGKKGQETELVVLQLLGRIPLRKETTTLAHTLVDLWSLTDWMAKDFINRIKEGDGWLIIVIALPKLVGKTFTEIKAGI